MALKASELSSAMVTALPGAWLAVKGTAFPGGDTKDAEVLFRAVAIGLLSYLEAHQADMVGSFTGTVHGVPNPGPFTVTNVNVNTDLT